MARVRFGSRNTIPASLRQTEKDIAALKESGWDERAIWEITALTSFFNFSGRLEAASGLPADHIPEDAKLAEARVS